jgi:hypothetical protein
MNRLKAVRVLLAAFGLLAFTLPAVPAFADTTPPTDFNLQVTPSPLVTTVKPGTKTALELKIRNNGSGAENLKIDPRAFTLNNNSSSVNLLDTAPADVAGWVSFSAPKFTIAPGEWFTENVSFNVPKDAGFSYSFALVITRQVNPKPLGGTQAINASLAVFTLVNVDRPGAKSSLTVGGFSSSKHMYEYLPAVFSIRFHNTGNTIAQPSGTLFIQHGTGKSNLATLPVNASNGYILPGTERTITANWDDGFPAYQTVHNPDGTTSQKLVWNWGNLSRLRIGRYTAHLVAVYNQAGRDVPIEGTVSFWVIPWKILLVLLTVVLLVLFALFMLVRMIIRGIKRRHVKRMAKKAGKAETPPENPDADRPV